MIAARCRLDVSIRCRYSALQPISGRYGHVCFKKKTFLYDIIRISDRYNNRISYSLHIADIGSRRLCIVINLSLQMKRHYTTFLHKLNALITINFVKIIQHPYDIGPISIFSSDIVRISGRYHNMISDSLHVADI